ncbi:MAG: hypothetical protein AAGG81_08555, partial [Chlamydiota bacterium]
PSPRYFELIEQHMKLHMQPCDRGKDVFAGQKMLGDIGRIKEIIIETDSQSILDYGSGKGRLYREKLISIQDDEPLVDLYHYWGVKEVSCYDPCYPPYSILPSGNFDGVVCIDVLEHCPEEDIHWIVRELFQFSRNFVYANIACGEAVKLLPNGKNVHATVRHPKWWFEVFSDIAADFPTVRWVLITTRLKSKEEGLWYPVKLYRGGDGDPTEDYHLPKN